MTKLINKSEKNTVLIGLFSETGLFVGLFPSLFAGHLGVFNQLLESSL